MSQTASIFLLSLVVSCVVCLPVTSEDNENLDAIKIKDESEWPFFKQDIENQRNKPEQQFETGMPNENGSDLPFNEIDPLENEELFEGDLKIPYELYKQYYLNEDNDKLKKRGAIRGTSRLWPSGVVYYYYDFSIDRPTGILIRQAMDDLEEKTCLRFLYSNDNSTVRIRFQRMLYDGCNSNFIGKMPDIYNPYFVQAINLGFGCNTKGIILHEIGHAIGFWHEQSRPDRDNYVKINWENVTKDYLLNFDKRNSWEVDHQASGYDYGSIMHYGMKFFVNPNCTNCTTIDVSNSEEYSRQGEPMIGQ